MKMTDTTLPDVGFVEFSSCNGCLMMIVNYDALLLELIKRFNLVQFRLASKGVWKGRFNVLFVEGVIRNEEEAEELRNLRARTDYLVAIGACAAMGGVTAGVDENTVAMERNGIYGKGVQDQRPIMPQPLHEIVHVDATIPGCPIDPVEFAGALAVILAGGRPMIPTHALCAECSLSTRGCLLKEGKPCLGPITRAGCRAICTARQRPCEGCRGLTPDANFPGLVRAAEKSGITKETLTDKMRIFNNRALTEQERGTTS